MAKVQFNCRLDEDVAEWIATESLLQSAARGNKFSQADVVSLLVNEEQNDREVTAIARTSHMRPAKQSDLKLRVQK